MTRVLILGGAGMLGHKLYQELGSQAEVFATFRDDPASLRDHPAYADADPRTLIGGVVAEDSERIAQVIDIVKPAVVINCIGIIKQLREAHDPMLSIRINALLPHELAEMCGAQGVRLIHLSTDCVFSGRRGNYSEHDSADPEDLYGRTKLLGEVDWPGCLTLRTSIIGRDPRKAVGLLEWFLSQQGRTVRGYSRAIYSGLPTRALSQIIGAIIAEHPQLAGLYHVASTPISKYDLLVALRDALGLDIEVVPDDGLRCDRSLNAERFIAATGYSIPAWPELIANMLTDPTSYQQGRVSHAAA